MSVTKQSYNVRIAKESWEKLRWAKLKTQSKSYSDLILSLVSNIEEHSSTKQKELVSFYLSFKKDLAKEFKTIMITREARKTLERVKLLSDEASFTLSDAVFFLIFVSSL